MAVIIFCEFINLAADELKGVSKYETALGNSSSGIGGNTYDCGSGKRVPGRDGLL